MGREMWAESCGQRYVGRARAGIPDVEVATARLRVLGQQRVDQAKHLRACVRAAALRTRHAASGNGTRLGKRSGKRIPAQTHTSMAQRLPRLPARRGTHLLHDGVLPEVVLGFHCRHSPFPLLFPRPFQSLHLSLSLPLPLLLALSLVCLCLSFSVSRSLSVSVSTSVSTSVSPPPVPAPHPAACRGAHRVRATLGSMVD